MTIGIVFIVSNLEHDCSIAKKSVRNRTFVRFWLTTVRSVRLMNLLNSFLLVDGFPCDRIARLEAHRRLWGGVNVILKTFYRGERGQHTSSIPQTMTTKTTVFVDIPAKSALGTNGT